MPFTTDTFARAAFKIGQGLGHTSNDRDPANESESSAFTFAAQEIFGDSIPTDPNTAVSNGIAAYVSLQLTQDSGNPLAYLASIPTLSGTDLDGEINPRTGSVYQNGDRVGYLIPTKYGTSYRAVLRDGATEIPPLASEDFYIDYRSGIITSEEALGLSDGYLDGYVYIGNFVSDRLTAGESDGYWDVSGSDIYNNNAGNVGIGTSSPSTLLHVDGISTLGGNVNVEGNIVFDSANRSISRSGAGSLSFFATQTSFGSRDVRILTGLDFIIDDGHIESGIADGGDAFTLDANNVTTSGTILKLQSNSTDLIEVDYSGNLLPSTNDTHNLGSPSLRWKDGYFSGSSVYIGDGYFSHDGTSLVANGGLSSPGSGIATELFGSGAVGSGDNSVVIGDSATSGTAQQNVVIGSGAAASNDQNNVVVGLDANARNDESVIIGALTDAGGRSIAIGSRAQAGTSSISYSTVIGYAAGNTTGDSCVVIGAQATTTNDECIILGRAASSTAVNQFVAGSNSYAITDVYFGEGVVDATPPTSVTINATGGSGADIDGSDLILAGGKPTGAGSGGSVEIQTASFGASGSTLQSLTTRLSIDEDGFLVHHGGAVFNEDGGSVDFRVEGDTFTHLIFADGSEDRVGIGMVPTSILSISSTSDDVTTPEGENSVVLQSDGNDSFFEVNAGDGDSGFIAKSTSNHLAGTFYRFGGSFGALAGIFGANLDQGLHLFTKDAEPVVFHTQLSEAARIDSDGYALFGTDTSPTVPAQVVVETSNYDQLRLKTTSVNEDIMLRFTEDNLLGAFIKYEGTDNELQIGTHASNDNTVGNDVVYWSMDRDSGEIINNQTCVAWAAIIAGGTPSFQERYGFSTVGASSIDMTLTFTAARPNAQYCVITGWDNGTIAGGAVQEGGSRLAGSFTLIPYDNSGSPLNWSAVSGSVYVAVFDLTS